MWRWHRLNSLLTKGNLGAHKSDFSHCHSQSSGVTLCSHAHWPWLKLLIVDVAWHFMQLLLLISSSNHLDDIFKLLSTCSLTHRWWTALSLCVYFALFCNLYAWTVYEPHLQADLDVMQSQTLICTPILHFIQNKLDVLSRLKNWFEKSCLGDRQAPELVWNITD